MRQRAAFQERTKSDEVRQRDAEAVPQGDLFVRKTTPRPFGTLRTATYSVRPLL